MQQPGPRDRFLISINRSVRQEQTRPHHVRQPGIEYGNTELDQPQNAGIQGPAYNLDFGTPDPVVVFPRVRAQRGPLLGGHEAVRQTIELGPDEIRRHRFSCKHQLKKKITV